VLIKTNGTRLPGSFTRTQKASIFVRESTAGKDGSVTCKIVNQGTSFDDF
jgi:hypothetical protein